MWELHLPFMEILRNCQTREKLITLLYYTSMLGARTQGKARVGQNSEGAWAFRQRGSASSIACGNTADPFIRSRQLMKLYETTGARRKARGSKRGTWTLLWREQRPNWCSLHFSLDPNQSASSRQIISASSSKQFSSKVIDDLAFNQETGWNGEKLWLRTGRNIRSSLKEK